MATYKIYCDESRQAKGQGKHMLLGSIWILQEYGWGFVNEFEGYCENTLRLARSMGHMKWESVPTKPAGKYYEAYKKLVDLYFTYNSEKIISFRAIVVDKGLYDFKHPVFHSGDYEAGFYNLYCQLVLNWIQADSTYHVRAASRTIKKSFPHDSEEFRLHLLRNKINDKFEQRVYRHFRPSLVELPIASVESRPAKSRRLIQLADILMGAVGSHWNNEHTQTNASKGRLFLANHIAKRLGRDSLKFETGWEDKVFNVFYFDTSKSF